MPAVQARLPRRRPVVGRLPLDAIGLILAVDRILDMIRTAVNVCGDAAVSCIVAKSENELDEKIFNG